MLVGTVLGLSVLAAATGADKPLSLSEAEAGKLFRKEIEPLLRQQCTGCHGEEGKKRGGLDLRDRAGLLKGGDGGAVIVPGHPEKSRLLRALTWEDETFRMPPKEANRLTPQQVEAVRRWVAAGAPWPKGDEWTGGDVVVSTSGGQSLDWTNRRYKREDIWAYQPVRRPAVPAIGHRPSAIGNPVDAFIRRKLSAKGLTPAPEADRLTLIRRVTFDLTGLPPNPAEVDAFLTDGRPDAYERLIDRLLASPHYGERMAQHWLDVTRYADTAGFSNDYERPTAWRYRDYVVRAFNHDKPFDRFILEQLAGDELNPDDPECLIAVGYLRMGPWEHTGMSVAAVTRQQFLDDVTNAVGVTFLAQPLRCASCHDHKFDPIPTKDYYRIQAVFAPVQFVERPLPYRPWENTTGFAEGRERTEKLLKDAKDHAGTLRRKNRQAIARYLKEHGVEKVTDLPEKKRPDRHHGLTKLEMSLQKVYQKRVNYFEHQLRRYQPLAFSVYDGSPNNYNSNRPVYQVPPPEKRNGKVEDVFVLKGGALESPGEKVTPGVLSAVYASNDAADPTDWNTIPAEAHGRRLAFARWVASEKNTLTARVIVNRVWQWHFGRGLVATPNNFGKMGARPTHPELLDWLATWFVENGWSVKKLHRLIMTSATYRQSGTHPGGRGGVTPTVGAGLPRPYWVDADNKLLARFPPRRLSAEEIRDAMLAVSGELNREMGGPGIFPEINWEVALQPRHIMGSVAPAYQPSPRPRQRNRRTLYVFRTRTLADPLREVFNQPDAAKSCGRRDETTVTPQVFALFNAQSAHDRALALARRLEDLSDDPANRVGYAFRLLYGRKPTAEETRLCLDHVTKMTKHHREHKPAPAPLPTKVKREMVEELTGESFEWEEELDVMKDYRRDLKPWDVGPETRAWSELCLVLLNANEFVYVY